MDQGIVTPHDHDVLSGRGNFVNYHAGNEHFRALVRKHKVAYVACPKPQKGKFSRMIVDEIRSRNPPGRFLKQDAATKLWYDIGEKKALDKTRQALREGAPEIMKEIGVGDEDGNPDEHELGRRNASEDEFSMPNNSVMPPMHDTSIAPPEMHPGSRVHSGQYVQQQMTNPYQQEHRGSLPGARSMNPPPPMMRNDVGPPQPQQPMSVNSIPGSQRIMRNPMAPSSGVVPVRSLAGIRQAMQQQAQRNNAYLQNQYQQGNHHQQQQQHHHHQHHQQHQQQQQQQQQGGMGGYGGGGVGYPNMQNMPAPSMMDQFEPRPIGPSSAGGPVSIDNLHQEYEEVGPLPARMPQRYPNPRDKQKEMHREASDRSITMEKVFATMGHSSTNVKGMDNSAVSMMSLSIGDIVTKLAGEDSKAASTDLDADQLAPLFDSSLKIQDRHRPQPKPSMQGPNNSTSTESKDLDKVLDMSVMSIGGELSVEDGSVLRMAGSSAELSFSNVFDESDVN